MDLPTFLEFVSDLHYEFPQRSQSFVFEEFGVPFEVREL